MTESAPDTPPADLSPREAAALEAMLAYVLAGLVAKRAATKRTAARALFRRPGQSEVPEVSGVPLGTVKVKHAAAGWQTSGEWLDYVRDQFPENIITTEAVSPAFTKAVQDKHMSCAEWVDVDLVTGEQRKRRLSLTSTLPGITFKPGDPSGTLEIKPDWDAAERVVIELLGANAHLFGLEPKELDQ